MLRESILLLSIFRKSLSLPCSLMTCQQPKLVFGKGDLMSCASSSFLRKAEVSSAQVALQIDVGVFSV